MTMLRMHAALYLTRLAVHTILTSPSCDAVSVHTRYLWTWLPSHYEPHPWTCSAVEDHPLDKEYLNPSPISLRVTVGLSAIARYIVHEHW